MTDITTLMNTYFVQSDDPYHPQTFSNSKVTPLIDGATYAEALLEALDHVGIGARGTDSAETTGHFILIANWWLGLSGGTYVSDSMTPSGFGATAEGEQLNPPFNLDGPHGASNMILLNILKQKAAEGVDVRILGWISPSIMGNSLTQFQGNSIAQVNALTMKSIKDLRAESTIGNKAVLNTIAHTAGAAHTKLVVIGTPSIVFGFTGGIDFEISRWAHPGHSRDELWHDVMAKVEGEAVQALYNWFRDMWNENLRRPSLSFLFEGEQMPSYLDRTPPLPSWDSRSISAPGPESGYHHWVQSLRTVPKFNYSPLWCFQRSSQISFAPNGLFEIRSALNRALTRAHTYIYMEDQAFWSQEIMTWVHQAVATNSDLRVILVTSGSADPNDPKYSPSYLCNSLDHGLLNGLSLSQREQIRMYKRLGDLIPGSNYFTDTIDIINITNVMDNGTTYRLTTDQHAPRDTAVNDFAVMHWTIRMNRTYDFRVRGNPAIHRNELITFDVERLQDLVAPTTGAYQLFQRVGVTIHSKTTLIDDAWAIIGSANVMQRSLYTDLEHCISIIDPDEQVVKEYRKALWNDHFLHNNPADFDDLQAAIYAWENTWGVAGSVPTRPPVLEPILLPIIPDEGFSLIDNIANHLAVEVDSRQPYGDICS